MTKSEKHIAPKTPGLVHHTSQPFFQAKLQVGPTDDVYEKEADLVADKVVRMGNVAEVQPKPVISSVQRMCPACENEEEQAQRKATGETSSEAPSIVDNVVNSGGGNRMDNGTRSFMENQFGYDFSNVKIHNDTVAAKSAQSINALAYTSGSNIVFNSGQYSPGTNTGKKLLAHELTHVVQQDHGRVHKKVQRADDASFERLSGIDGALSSGTMASDATVMGNTYTATCRFRNYDLSFKFTKAYKGIYHYRSQARDVKAVYVKIEISINDRQYCGRCTPMRILQTLRSTRKNTSGNLEATDPIDPTRRERSGWSNTRAPSRGWRVDTLTTATDPFVTGLSYHANEGSETTPAVLWDAPGDWATDTNCGKDFLTCAVCEDASHTRWVAGCVNWGYYIDGSGNIVFQPATPVATCGAATQVQDASTRWDGISGNTPTGITF